MCTSIYGKPSEQAIVGLCYGSVMNRRRLVFDMFSRQIRGSATGFENKSFDALQILLKPLRFPMMVQAVCTSAAVDAGRCHLQNGVINIFGRQAAGQYDGYFGFDDELTGRFPVACLTRNADKPFDGLTYLQSD